MKIDFQLYYLPIRSFLALTLLFMIFRSSLQAQNSSFPSIGSVGIGTNPIAKLDVLAGSGTTILHGSGPNAYILISNVGSGESYYQASTSHRFQGAAGLESFTIPSNGKVGTETINPIAALDVNGLIQISALNRSVPPRDINYKLFPYSGIGL